MENENNAFHFTDLNFLRYGVQSCAKKNTLDLDWIDFV